jgi:hypothetical protein
MEIKRMLNYRKTALAIGVATALTATQAKAVDYTTKTDADLNQIVSSCFAASKASFVDISESDFDDIDVTRTLFPSSAIQELRSVPPRGVRKQLLEKLRKEGGDTTLAFFGMKETDSFFGVVTLLSRYECELREGAVAQTRSRRTLTIKGDGLTP